MIINNFSEKSSVKAQKILSLKPYRIADVLPLEIFSNDSGRQDVDFLINSRCGFEVYYAIGKYYKPETLFEVGTRFGYSLCSLLKGSGQVKFFCSWDSQEMESNSQHKAMHNVDSHIDYPGSSVWRIKNSQAEHTFDEGQFDLAHIDGDHHYESCLHDMELLLGHCKVMVIDDYRSHGNTNFNQPINFVEPAVQEFIKRHKDKISDHFYVDSYEGLYVIEFLP